MDAKRLGLIAAAAVILVLGYVGYQMVSNNQQTTPEPQTTTQATTAPTINSTPATDSGTPAAGVKEFTVDGSNFKFQPSTLTVNQGDKVRITFKNIGGTHDFVIDALNIKTKTIQSGEDETVEFTADKAGSFEYYCSVGNHRAMGMKGTLTVN